MTISNQHQRSKTVLIALLTSAVSLCALSASAVTRYCRLASGASGEAVLVVDSVQFRDDVTRLYGHIDGQPHRANRIDSMTLTPAKAREARLATDIDGVDFKRWFQWEDEPVIPLEIDFAPMKPCDSFTVECHTPKGTLVWTYDSTIRQK